jgi:crotonobetainyl-CoA:carnitine CoA-transferase CaiB-like acyl-CoA transferase
MSQPQIKEVNALTDVPVTGQKDVRVVDSPLAFSRATKREYGSVPLLGEHTQEVLARLGLDQ